MGNGVVIRDNIVLTIGYLVTEAQTVWLTSGETTTPGHVLGYDQATGFGLIQALGQLNLPALPLGDSDAAKIGDPVVIAGAGGLEHAVAAHVSPNRNLRVLGVSARRSAVRCASASALGWYRAD